MVVATIFRMASGVKEFLMSFFRHCFFEGVPFTPLIRLIDAEYSDGKSLPRGGLRFSTLPSPRAVSLAVHQELEQPRNHKDVSVMVMQWGQFLDHDVTLTPGTFILQKLSLIFIFRTRKTLL